MVQMSGVYLGEKNCRLTHEPSKSQIETDAPKDNHGRGLSFSPTDLLAASLGACMLTVMAIWAEQNQLDLRQSKYQVTKEMSSNPRRVSRLTVQIYLPSRLSTDNRQKLEEIAHNCPVKLSLNPNIQIPIEFHYV